MLNLFRDFIPNRAYGKLITDFTLDFRIKENSASNSNYNGTNNSYSICFYLLFIYNWLKTEKNTYTKNIVSQKEC